jgi:hypothetical protein
MNELVVKATASPIWKNSTSTKDNNKRESYLAANNLLAQSHLVVA